LTTFLPAANAQSQKCYTVASLQGNYSIVATYGANVAMSLGSRSYDGNGNLTGTFVVNEPTAGSTTGAGQFTRVLMTNGVSTNQVDDFVITSAVVLGGQLIATAIADAQETPSAIVAGGIFVTRVHTRLPDFFN
jgi:hypothetical protein